MLAGSMWVHTNDFIGTDFKIWFGSKDCKDLLEMCLALDPKERATLEEMQQHCWLNSPMPPHSQPPHSQSHHPQTLGVWAGGMAVDFPFFYPGPLYPLYDFYARFLGQTR
ncbi:unnamed protein product [Pleuronectes platessa]|uniref:Protein kinase domain-containing protein n=1 Tax=Pleuronectes platessa TaxID=8262 RepID=A0A9N7UT55_PLEPL|nr:unnamed protein product [Pleuronectes platessa]